MFKNIIKKIILNDDDDLLFCTDLHGQYEQFELLLAKNHISKNTKIICTGDIIDRGPNSLPLLLNFLNNPNYFLSLGNHELALVYAPYSKSDMAFWVGTGGQETFNELGKSGTLFFSNEIRENIPYILEIEHRGKKYGIVHACIPKLNGVHITEWEHFLELAQNNPNYLSDAIHGQLSTFNSISAKPKFENENFIYHDEFPRINGIDYILHGHYGVKKTVISNNQIWFDTWFLTKDHHFTAYIPKGEKFEDWKRIIKRGETDE